MFGAQGSSNFLSRSTAILATLFFLTSLSLAYLNKSEEEPGSLLDRAPITESVIEPEEPVKADTSDAPVIPE